jgi:hypothetical protein
MEQITISLEVTAAGLGCGEWLDNRSCGIHLAEDMENKKQTEYLNTHKIIKSC